MQAGREWGLKAGSWGALESLVQRGSRNREAEPVPCHIPLKSKCRGTSAGRGGSVAQRLGRQAVTALGCGPARLAQLHPTPAHPIWPRQAQESGRLPPVVSAEPCMTGVPSRSLSIRWERPPAERPLSSPLHGPRPESAVYDNLSSLAGRSAFRACTWPHIPMATVARPSHTT